MKRDLEIPDPYKAPKAWSDHNPLRWGPCPTIEECTKKNRCPFRDEEDGNETL